ncbi:MAG: acyl-[ACP]--phospholipid O-acyltransferase [Nitrospirota bacterium]|nr:acyl-[ACP]--phospholipid O-acyltransferase [Nitrospirota bacterium]
MTETNNGTAAEGKRRNLPGSFFWLNATQFFGALNDNIVKLLMVFFIIGQKGPSEAGIAAAKAGAVFVLPFLLFSSFAGVVADRISKQRIIAAVKLMEVAVTVLGTFFFFEGNEAGLYVVLFLMATHSAFFAPSKYGIIPELVGRERLSFANGLLESFSYLAIILGTATASLLSEMTGANYPVASLFCVAISLAGLMTSARIEKTPAAGSDKGFSLFFLKDIGNSLRYVGQDGELLLAVLGSAYFMVLAAFTQINLIPYGMQLLSLTQEKSGYLFLMTALGIGAGSLTAGKLSGRGVEFGIVPLGTLGLTASALALHFIPPSLSLVILLIFVLGLSAGLFIVPLQTFIQMRSPKERLGEILAASVFLNWTGVLLASGLTYLLSSLLKLSSGQAFVVLGFLTLVLTLITMKVLPDFFVRFLALLLTRFCYRIRVTGNDNIPVTGPALLISNHVTWVDALLLGATQQRRIRFIMERRIYNKRLLNPLFRLMKVIPVSSEDSPRQITASLQDARAALDQGYLVCIFAEGAITRNGMLREFRPGFERIVKGTAYPVIPVYIGGAWGSIFSYAHGRLLSRLPVRFPYPVSIIFGKPLPSASGPFEMKQAVTELSCDYFESLRIGRKSLGEMFTRTARKNWRRNAVSDTSGKNLTYGHTLAGAIALSEEIKKIAPDQDKIGILLPPSAAGAMANLAVILRGGVAVNLNYTVSAEAFRSSAGQCNLRTVITSKAFLEKFSTLPVIEGMVYIEDLMARISPSAKRKAWLKARLLPCRLLLPNYALKAKDLATIIFSSGSTGDPKGVMLTHHNILSNIEALQMVFRVVPDDNICSALPFFHSLGFTGTLWLPLLSGFSASYHTNPMDGSKIADVVRERRSTLLIATPTFLLAYIRRAASEDFRSLRLVVAGAEKLKKRIADAFEERFGIRPLEGYGATELSPVVALNLPDVEIDGVRQRGSREGSVGHPIPGVAVKITDPETGAPLAAGAQGLILVKGPNLMRGYLGRPEQTADVVSDGWYSTGDLGWLDGEGFLTITDRLSRFSKIGGEMVPHLVIEEELCNRLNLPGQALAVTSIPDEKKGERLVVLYAKGTSDTGTLHRALKESLLPNLWKPDRNHYLEVEALPVLGSGKLDIRGLRQMAREVLGHRNA